MAAPLLAAVAGILLLFLAPAVSGKLPICILANSRTLFLKKEKKILA
jgi:hypothetical protein